ncbi:MAG: small multi-drug export protein [Parcubacteria group bacterium]|nr:small multi-drug export protein [Parcubacteria group bacterium]
MRLAIPLALGSLHLPVAEAFALSVFGNMVPVVFLLLFLDLVSKFLSDRSRFWARFFTWVFDRTRRKIIGKWEVYGAIALVVFVAIPLPLTGAWSGAAAAYLLGIPFWRAFWLIFLGVLIAGLAVTLTSVGVLRLL